jgi:putative metallohydrolase (TIGR04338 family)
MSELPDGVTPFRNKRAEFLVQWRAGHAARPRVSTELALATRPDPFNLPVERWFKNGKPGRDSMKQRCYYAENVVMMAPYVHQRIFSEIVDVAEYCRDVMETEWFQARWPAFHSLIVKYRGNKNMCLGGPRSHIHDMTVVTSGCIQMTDWGMGWHTDPPVWGGEMVVLHELAHALTPWRGHNRLWVRTYIELVRYAMTPEHAELLTEQFIARRVKFKPYRAVAAAA